MNKGIPLTANKYMEIDGISLNFRTPLVHSLALGGGSVVKVERKNKSKITVHICKESIAFKLVEEAVSFEKGTVLCNTDFAL